MNVPTFLLDTASVARSVFFDRQKLMIILALYAKMVALGEWHDHAITGLREPAEFAIYRVGKHPKLDNQQEIYALLGKNGWVLRRGHELGPLLKELA
jgi:hypothetical protein